MKKHGNAKRVINFFLLLSLILCVAMPMKAFAQEKEKKVVRVGWHEAPYFITDENGRLSGYSYEYQRKVAAHWLGIRVRGGHVVRPFGDVGKG